MWRQRGFMVANLRSTALRRHIFTPDTYVWILFYRFLHQHRQAIKSLPHISRTASNPDLCPNRHRDHDLHSSSASANGPTRDGVAHSDKRRTRPLRNTTSIIAL